MPWGSRSVEDGYGIEPKPSPKHYRLAEADDHVIEFGDNSIGIGARFGASVDRLTEVNGIQNPNLILEGDLLLIPGGDLSEAGVSA